MAYLDHIFDEWSVGFAYTHHDPLYSRSRVPAMPNASGHFCSTRTLGASTGSASSEGVGQAKEPEVLHEG